MHLIYLLRCVVVSFLVRGVQLMTASVHDGGWSYVAALVVAIDWVIL